MAKTCVESELANKLFFWDTLPWKLAALAHPDESTARAKASEILAEWGQLDQTPQKHHPLTNQVLQSEEIVLQIRQFIDGAGRDTLLDLLPVVSRLRFIPTTERTVEGRFSQAETATVNRSAQPSYVSTALRLSQWRKDLKRGPHIFEDVVSTFDHIRKKARIACELGLERPPQLADHLVSYEVGAIGPHGQPVHPQAIRDIVGRVMYGWVPSEQYVSMKVARVANRKLKHQKKRFRSSVGGAPRDVKYENMYEKAFFDHFRAQAIHRDVIYMLDLENATGVEIARGLVDKRRRTAAPGGASLQLEDGCEYGTAVLDPLAS
eukprot:1257499-Pyramimonas_sp.AAC.1